MNANMIKRTTYPTYLYRANSDSPLIANNLEEYAKAVNSGWSDKYSHIAYPLWTTLDDGSRHLVHTKEEHDALIQVMESIAMAPADPEVIVTRDEAIDSDLMV